mgnify:FL=1
MLQLRNITKDYQVGDSKVAALKGISLSFRRNEFVSILGASGCGKTTLLNIIGGLDHYTSGDLIIEGISTKDYKDGDWDTYRNHRIGFVFQTYNLIPHQTVLANVELALTLSGVSPKERKARATEALNRVGLGSELNKRPNQLSGGQMQRVAIARALVNNPEILLADEPTGALDTNTSVQIMDLIKEIAGERLVIMVTHNPELAYKYSTRIVELKDGLVVSDSAPYSEEEEREEVLSHRAEVQAQQAEAAQEAEEGAVEQKSAGKAKRLRTKKHSSMSLVTAFFLSGKNLLTKKARTLITAIAGSIGIISVCLVLALSAGFNNYISQTEEDMLSYYPVQVSETSIDLNSAMSSFMNGSMNLELDKVEDKVYINSFLSQLAQGMTTTNDLTDGNKATIDGKEMTYLEYLEAMPEELYNAIMYSYGVNISTNLFTDVEIGSGSTSEGETTSMHMSLESLREYYTYLLTYRADEFSNLTQFVRYFTDVVSVMPNTDFSAENYGEYVQSQYDVIYGDFPENENQVVLVVGDSNDVIDLTLVQLGFMTEEEFLDLFISSEDGVSEDEEPASISFDEIVGKEYTLYYNDSVYVDEKYNLPVELTGYNYFYDGYSVASEDEAPVTEEEGTTIEISGILRLKDGLTYGCLSSGLCITESLLQSYIQHNMQSAVVKTLQDAINSGSPETIASTINSLVCELTFESMFQTTQGGGSGSIALDKLTPKYNSTSVTASELVRELGGNDTPSGISVYAKDFTTKQEMLDYMSGWNSAVEAARTAYFEEHGTYDGYDGPTEITYSDTVGTLMGMVNTILNAITYVLVAFTAISLVVSTVMIGVITYVSVVERTKEIGILRSIGARKRDIRHVFNAETFIIGLFAGLIGILVAYLLQGIINLILTPLTGISGLAALPIWQAIIMVCVSVALTLVSGLIPASAAAKKDPVIALRTE